MIRAKRAWVESSCPFEAAHSSGRDSSPSFGVSINADGHSRWKCFVCGSGLLSDFVFRAISFSKTHPSQKAAERIEWLDKFIREHDVQLETSLSDRFKALPDDPMSLASFPAGGKGKPAAQIDHIARSKECEETPESDLSTYFVYGDKMRSEMATWKDRIFADKISRMEVPTAEAWGIGYHRKKRRVSIPARDHFGRLLSISGRSVDYQKGVSKFPKFLHSEGFRRDFILFGEHMLVPARPDGDRPGILTEGFWEGMFLWQMGYRNIVGLLGTFPSGTQIAKLTTFFSRLAILPDGDDAGMEMAERVSEVVSRKIPTLVCETPRGLDPDEMLKTQIQGRLNRFDPIVV